MEALLLILDAQYTEQENCCPTTDKYGAKKCRGSPACMKRNVSEPSHRKKGATQNCRAHHNTARHSLSYIHVTITLQHRDNERVKLNLHFCPFAFMERTGIILSIAAFAVH
jgi:hypothetical protein